MNAIPYIAFALLGLVVTVAEIRFYYREWKQLSAEKPICIGQTPEKLNNSTKP